MRSPDGGLVHHLWATSLAPPNGFKAVLLDRSANVVHPVHDLGTEGHDGLRVGVECRELQDIATDTPTSNGSFLE
jgi:hypothetical protein